MLLKFLWRNIIIPGIVVIGYFYGHLLFQEPAPSPVNFNMFQSLFTFSLIFFYRPQKEVKSQSLLLNKTGAPEDFGYMVRY